MGAFVFHLVCPVQNQNNKAASLDCAGGLEKSALHISRPFGKHPWEPACTPWRLPGLVFAVSLSLSERMKLKNTLEEEKEEIWLMVM